MTLSQGLNNIAVPLDETYIHRMFQCFNKSEPLPISHHTPNLVHPVKCHYENVKRPFALILPIKITRHYANQHVNTLSKIYIWAIQAIGNDVFR